MIGTLGLSKYVIWKNSSYNWIVTDYIDKPKES